MTFQGFPAGGSNAVVSGSIGEYGDGSDGDVSIAAGTNLARDMFYRNLTVNGGGQVNAFGFRIMVQQQLTVAAGGVIAADGSAAVGLIPGGASPVGTLGGGVAGSAGSANAGGPAGSSIRESLGGAGGAGGAGTAGAGKASGTVTAPEALRGSVRSVPQSILGRPIAGVYWSEAFKFSGEVFGGAGAAIWFFVDYIAAGSGLQTTPLLYPIRRSYTYVRLRVNVVSNAAATTTTFEVYKAGVATGILVTFATLVTGEAVAEGSVAWSAGQALDLRGSNNAAVGNIFAEATVELSDDEGNIPIQGGAGGGGGTGDGANAGGGGGGGGGVLVIAARTITNNGIIRAVGGAGANGVAGNSGGGGGGGGGVVLLTRSAEAGAGTVSVAGGVGGNAVGAGSANGVAGSVGTIIRVPHG